MTMTAGSEVAAARPQRSTGPFGVVVFLASDVMLFAPFFAAYFLLRSTNSPWPAAGAELDTPRAAAATVVLVASSFVLIAGDRAFDRGDRRMTRRALLFTMALGIIFIVNQLAEYATLSFRADDNTYGSIYWGLTGLHTLHVFGGVCVLGLLYIRVSRTKALDEVRPWSRGVSMFWHLVDVIWIGVFTTIWIIR